MSLPGEAITWIGERDCLQAFAEALRSILVRALTARGHEALVVMVTELQPERSAAECRPCPHWHCVFVGKDHKPGSWYFKPSELDAMIVQALGRVGCHGIDCGTAGRAVPVSKSVRAYLSCYLRKKNVDTSRWRGTEHEALLPRQWWQWSRPLQQWVKGLTVPTDPAFLPWVHQNRVALQERRLIRWRVVELDNPLVPVTLEINWLSLNCLAVVLSLWHEVQWDLGWWEQHLPADGCAHHF